MQLSFSALNFLVCLVIWASPKVASLAIEPIQSLAIFNSSTLETVSLATGSSQQEGPSAFNTQPSPSTNLSLPGLGLGVANYHCDDEPFGNPKLESCQDALAQMSDAHLPLVFGDRDGPGNFVVTLPLRYSSCA